MTYRPMQFLTWASAVAAAMLVATAVAFGTGSVSAQTGEAKVRVLHASPDAPAVDVYVDGSEAVSDLAFNEITGYVALAAGSHAIKVYPASANGSGTPVIDVPSLAVEAGKDYTIAAVGLLADIEPLVLADNNAAPAAGQAHLRVVHASPDAPNVDVFAEGAGVVVSDLAFKEASEYLPLAAGSYNLEIRPAGSMTAVLDLNGVQLEAGKVYTAFAVGLAEGEPTLTVNLTTDATAQAASPTPSATAAVTPTPTSGALPSSGGPPGTQAGTGWLWLVAAGVAIAGASVAGMSLVAVRARDRS